MKDHDMDLVQHLTPPEGIEMPAYPAVRDRVYRFSLVAFVVGLTGTAVGDAGSWLWMQTASHGLAASAMVVTGWTFLVWLKSWRWLVRGLVIAGLVLWLINPIAGWGATLAASAIVAAKEHHCFHFWSGRFIPWMTLLLGAGLVSGLLPRPAQAVLWIALAWFWIPLLTGRFRLPLFEI